MSLRRYAGELWCSLGNEGQKKQYNISIDKAERVIAMSTLGGKRRMVFEKKYKALELLSTFSKMQHGTPAPGVRISGQTRWHYLVLNVKPEADSPAEVVVLSTHKALEFKRCEHFLSPDKKVAPSPRESLKQQVQSLQTERDELRAQLKKYKGSRSSPSPDPEVSLTDLLKEETSLRAGITSAYISSIHSLCMVLAEVFAREVNNFTNTRYNTNLLTTHQKKLEEHASSVGRAMHGVPEVPRLHLPGSVTVDALERDTLLEAAEQYLMSEVVATDRQSASAMYSSREEIKTARAESAEPGVRSQLEAVTAECESLRAMLAASQQREAAHERTIVCLQEEITSSLGDLSAMHSECNTALTRCTRLERTMLEMERRSEQLAATETHYTTLVDQLMEARSLLLDELLTVRDALGSAMSSWCFDAASSEKALREAQCHAAGLQEAAAGAAAFEELSSTLSLELDEGNERASLRESETGARDLMWHTFASCTTDNMHVHTSDHAELLAGLRCTIRRHAFAADESVLRSEVASTEHFARASIFGKFTASCVGSMLMARGSHAALEDDVLCLKTELHEQHERAHVRESENGARAMLWREISECALESVRTSRMREAARSAVGAREHLASDEVHKRSIIARDEGHARAALCTAQASAASACLALISTEVNHRGAVVDYEQEVREGLWLCFRRWLEEELCTTLSYVDSLDEKLYEGKQLEYSTNKQVRILQKECSEMQDVLSKEREAHVMGQQELRRLLAGKDERNMEAAASVKELNKKVIEMQIRLAGQEAQMGEKVHRLQELEALLGPDDYDQMLGAGADDVVDKVRSLKEAVAKKDQHISKLAAERVKAAAQLASSESSKQRAVALMARQVKELETRCRVKDDEIMKLEEWAVTQACQQAQEIEQRWRTDVAPGAKVAEYSKRAEIAESNEWELRKENGIIKQQLQQTSKKYEALKVNVKRSASAHCAKTREPPQRSTTQCSRTRGRALSFTNTTYPDTPARGPGPTAATPSPFTVPFP